MKVKELFSILEKYNYIANLTMEKEKYIHFSVDGDWKGKFKTFTEFKKWLKEEYIDSYVTEILLQGYTLNQERTIGFWNVFGEYEKSKIKFEV